MIQEESNMLAVQAASLARNLANNMQKLNHNKSIYYVKKYIYLLASLNEQIENELEENNK